MTILSGPASGFVVLLYTAPFGIAPDDRDWGESHVFLTQLLGLLTQLTLIRAVSTELSAGSLRALSV